MEIVVSSIAAKRDLVTLDLLGPDPSSGGGLDPPLRISSDGDDVPPLDLNQAPDDVGPRREVEAAAAAAEEALQGGQSVCTIEKVKQALERETERRKGAASDGGEGSPLSTSASPSSSSSSSVTTVSAKRFADRGDEGSAHDRGDSAAAAAAAEGSGGSLVVAGCSGCLSYVLIPKGNPRCPRCDARVAPPPAPPKKKPRIDLNFSLTTL